MTRQGQLALIAYGILCLAVGSVIGWQAHLHYGKPVKTNSLP